MKYVIIAKNKKAYHDYHIEEELESGIVLLGSEVKSLRKSKCSISESYCDITKGEVFLIGSTISEYPNSKLFQHKPKRIRKLLLHKKQIKKISGKIKQKGFSLVPLSIFFNKKNLVKLSLGIVKGKKLHEKRHELKKREWQKEKSQLLKKQTLAF